MARRRVPISGLRSMPPSNSSTTTWRRVGCKRTAPNAVPPLKKKPYRGVTADNDVSVSDEGNWGMFGHCGTSENNLLSKGEDLYVQNSHSTEFYLSARGTSHLLDMHPQHDMPKSNYSATGGDLHLLESPPKYVTAEESNKDKKEEQIEMIPDLQEPNEGVTAYINDVSVSDKGNWSMFGQCSISENTISPKGEDLYVQNSNSTECHLSARDALHLPDMHPQCDTPENDYLALGGHLSLPDSHLKWMTAEGLSEDKEEEKIEVIPNLQEPNKGATADNNDVSMSDKGSWRMFGQCGTSENNVLLKVEDLYLQNSISTKRHFSAGSASHLPDNMHPQRDTPESKFSAIGGNLHLRDSHSKYFTTQEPNEDEEASDAESRVNRWACRVCKVAVVSIVVLPCSHLCLCWDCEERSEDCPVCGQAKRDVFYINF